MAVSLFLKIEGINGESQDPTHKGWIEVLSFSWGLAFIATTDGAEKPQTGTPYFSAITALKRMDSVTPALAFACASGKPFATTAIDIVKTGGSFFTLILKDVILFSLHESGSSDAPVESLSFAYANVGTALQGQQSVPLHVRAGDANDDGTFSSQDIQDTLHIFSGEMPPDKVDPAVLKALDVVPPGGDGVVDARDLNKLLRLWLGVDQG